jgi:ABC-type branched-subunit amino acid transport system ATPase component/predicted MFS family arabinose efflux permease
MSTEQPPPTSDDTHRLRDQHRSATELAASIVVDEDEHLASRRDDDLDGVAMPGSSTPPMSLSEGLRTGGVRIALVLLVFTVLEEFDRVAMQVLGPDIQDSLGISDTVLLGLQSFGGVVLVLATMPFAWLADRRSRIRVLSAASGVWAIFVALSGAVVNSFQLGVARAGSGLGASARIPIGPSLVADQYPLGVRTRIFAVEALGRPLGQVLGPLFAGAVVLLAGNDAADWRVVFLVLSVPAVLTVAWSLSLSEPIRGGQEQEAVLGAKLTDDIVEPPVRLSAAFQRLKKVRTFYYLVIGIGVLGFALIAVPGAFNLLLEDAYGYDAYRRGWIGAITWSGALIGIPLAGRIGERVFRRDPATALRLMGLCIVAYGVFVTVGMRFQNAAVMVAFVAIGNAFQGAAFTQLGPAISAIIPYQMRSQAFAMVGVYIFLMGGFFGGLLAGALSDAHGERTALTVIVPPAALLGGFLIVYGSRFMRRDIALTVAELRELKDEHARMAANPDDIPVLQVRNVDVSYGNLQVLFDVGFEVRRGECLALLGTNGAGKSTILRAISGLVMPDRGVIRMNGRTITLVDPQFRASMGLVQIPGGEAVFRSMTVEENLELWSRQIPDVSRRRQRRALVDETFPVLRDRSRSVAGSLSGGQQQMLALAKAVMLEPELLCIDELSLGLAPVVVQDLLAVVENLKAQGLTMIIVEQSVNVALTVADRAVFMERGEVRFEGPAQDLLERGDLLRAVFLSGSGA